VKIKLPKLHNQILIGLIFGAIFGSIFKVNTHLLIIKTIKNNQIIETSIENWKKITFYKLDEPKEISFGTDQQLEIISQFKKLKLQESEFSLLAETDSVIKFENVQFIGKEETIAQSIKWLGDIFIRLLNMIAVPLVLASLIVGAASLGDIKKFARIGSKTLAFYLITTAIAIVIGLIIANVIRPGEIMNPETKDRLMSVYQPDLQSKLESEVGFSIKEMIVDLVPRNPIGAIANSQMLQIVFFSVMVGMVLTLIKKEKSNYVINFFDGLSEVMIKLVDVVMLIAPIGVFALISATVSEFGFDILQTLFWYAVTLLIGLVIHTFGIYALILRLFSKTKVTTFFKEIRRMQAIAFTTSSSAATLPVNMEVCQDNLGISKSLTSFVLPLGATINMDGTAMYQGVAAVFIAQVFGMDLTIGQQLTIVLTAVLASIGTAPIPGVGIIMLIIVLKAAGIPEEGIALIMGVDRILDMCRTTVNVTGDAAVCCAVASSENEITLIT
jgi:Na+/H+-dicarboxylate symporter